CSWLLSLVCAWAAAGWGNCKLTPPCRGPLSWFFPATPYVAPRARSAIGGQGETRNAFGIPRVGRACGPGPHRLLPSGAFPRPAGLVYVGPLRSGSGVGKPSRQEFRFPDCCGTVERFSLTARMRKKQKGKYHIVFRYGWMSSLPLARPGG